MKFIKYNFFTFLFVFSLFFFSCNNERLLNLKQQELFTLNYGSFENELNMFPVENSGNINTHITMQDGFFS